MALQIEVYSDFELVQITQEFFKELILAESGNSKCLNFFKTSLPEHSFLDEPEKFQVMTIGGSNFKTALIEQKIGKPYKILESTQSELPLIESSRILLDLVEKNLYPEVQKLILNFAFPIENIIRSQKLDAILIKGTKQHNMQGLVGVKLGELIENHIKTRLNRNLDVMVANDIVCLLSQNSEKGENMAAGIVGTGYNTGFRINDNQIVNLESGNFDKFMSTATGKIIDAQSTNPGHQFFEKEVSGAYLYKHYNLLVDLKGPKLGSTIQLNILAQNGDKTAIALLERSASLVATQLAGIYLYLGETKTVFNMEGSMFWDGFEYRENIKKYLKKLRVPTSDIKFVQQKDSFQGAIALGVVE